MMNITIGERCSGKTTKLIKRSAYEGVYILVATKHRAQALVQDAERMGLKIPFPITIDEYLRDRDKFKFKYSDVFCGLLIDDADDVLQQVFAGIPIREVTVTDSGNISWLKPVKYEDHVKRGKWNPRPYFTPLGPMYGCSCCGNEHPYKADYCDFCGVKMDLEEK